MAKKLKKKRDKSEKKASALDRLVEGLALSEETLHSDIAGQAELFYAAASYRVDRLRAKTAAEAALSVARVDAATQCRQAAEDEGRKITVQAVEEHVSGQPDVVKLTAERDEARALEEHAKLLVEAYYQRSAMARSFAQLLSVPGASESGLAGLENSSEQLKQKVRDRYDG